MKRLSVLLLLTLFGTGCSKALLPAVMIGAVAADVALTAHMRHQHSRHCHHGASRTYVTHYVKERPPAPAQTKSAEKKKMTSPPGDVSPKREVYHPKDSVF